MKENKSERLQVRLTSQEKEQIKEYAANHNLSMSEAIRILVYLAFEQDKNS